MNLKISINCQKKNGDFSHSPVLRACKLVFLYVHDAVSSLLFCSLTQSHSANEIISSIA